ncbi:Hypothetical predicted protein [Scomber scombrus]|uniref:Uncharacterized protein n=1 Tax=Scomber scombrus TaxID=13677 RepID=A0AAV1P9R9_SCOSC
MQPRGVVLSVYWSSSNGSQTNTSKHTHREQMSLVLRSWQQAALLCHIHAGQSCTASSYPTPPSESTTYAYQRETEKLHGHPVELLEPDDAQMRGRGDRREEGHNRGGQVTGVRGLCGLLCVLAAAFMSSRMSRRETSSQCDAVTAAPHIRDAGVFVLLVCSGTQSSVHH